jgi:ABC-type antimicrobial peptide transport system permease subunit
MFVSMPAAKKLIRENRKLMDSAGVKEDIYSTIYINAEDVDSVQGILSNLKEMGYQVSSPTEWINQMKEEYGRQQSQLIAIALISLLVSAIGIANTMLASILERRQEIGVMKVIGLSIRKINLMFLVEAALIGLLGGVIAIVVSYIVAAVASTGGSAMSFLGMNFAAGVRITIPLGLSMGALAIAVGIGIISGIYPAWRATRMSPLEAIRGSN